MATITRTAKGTASDKSSSLTLSLPNVEVQPHALLVAGYTYKDGAGAPVVKWGNRICKPFKTQAGNGIVTRLVGMVYDGDTARTRGVVATWTTTAPTAKVMFATMVESAAVPDLEVSQAEAATTDPDSGTAAETTFADEVCIGVFGSEGPGSDTSGSIQNDYTSGQRQGVAGAPPVSNVTIHEVYKILTTTEVTAAAKTGATSRDWCTLLVTFRAPTWAAHGITNTDIVAVAEYFAANSLDMDDAVFWWNAALDRWEVYTADLDTHGTFRIHQDNGWV